MIQFLGGGFRIVGLRCSDLRNLGKLLGSGCLDVSDEGSTETVTGST